MVVKVPKEFKAHPLPPGSRTAASPNATGIRKSCIA
jgi:hypothetical protein